MKVHPCVGCGYCCRRAPCGFGTTGPDGGCADLEPAENGTFRCSKYEEILQEPFANLSPAFGAGCSSTIFNEDRRRVILGSGTA